MTVTFEQSVNGITAPQDRGTGVPINVEDYTSSGYIGGLAAKANNSDYVENGLGIQNVGDGTFDITTGLCFVLYQGDIFVQDENGQYVKRWDVGVTFAILIESAENLQYEEDSNNYIFIDVDLSQNDEASIVVDSGFNPPEDPSLLIGKIDSSGDVELRNRGQDFESDTTMEGSPLITGEKQWEIQLNGSDEEGVINIKTE